MPPVAEALIAGLVAGVTAALVAWGTVRVHLHYMRRDLDRHDSRIEDLERWRLGHPMRRKTDLPRVRSD